MFTVLFVYVTFLVPPFVYFKLKLSKITKTPTLVVNGSRLLPIRYLFRTVNTFLDCYVFNKEL